MAGRSRCGRQPNGRQPARPDTTCRARSSTPSRRVNRVNCWSTWPGTVASSRPGMPVAPAALRAATGVRTRQQAIPAGPSGLWWSNAVAATAARPRGPRPRAQAAASAACMGGTAGSGVATATAASTRPSRESRPGWLPATRRARSPAATRRPPATHTATRTAGVGGGCQSAVSRRTAGGPPQPHAMASIAAAMASANAQEGVARPEKRGCVHHRGCAVWKECEDGSAYCGGHLLGLRSSLALSVFSHGKSSRPKWPPAAVRR